MAAPLGQPAEQARTQGYVKRPPLTGTTPKYGMSACKRETICRGPRSGSRGLNTGNGPVFQHSVDQAELLGFAGREELIPLHRPLDLLDRPTRVLNVHLVQTCPGLQNLAGVDLDVGGLALGAARRLVDHDAGVGQR